MSVADLPQCVQDCLKSVAKDAGCDANDLECFCTKEADPMAGITFGLCVAGNPFSLGSEESSSGCKDSALSFYGGFQSICQKGGFSSSNASAGSVGTATSNPPAKTDSTNPSTGVTATPTSETSESSPSPLSSQSPNNAEADNASTSGSTSSTSTSSGLSPGAAAGIGVGGAVLAMLLALGLFLLWRKKRKQKRAVADSAEDESGAAEVSGKSAVRAEAPGSEPQYELYGQQTHTSELNSHTNGCNASLSPFTKEPESTGVVYELSADSGNAETVHER